MIRRSIHQSCIDWKAVRDWEKAIPETRREEIHSIAEGWIKKLDPSYRIDWSPSPGYPYSWDGSGLLRMGTQKTILALHDIGHIYYSPADRRREPEFGLGADPYHASRAPITASRKRMWWEELTTCHLNWAMAAYLEGINGGDLIASETNCEESAPYALSDAGLLRFARIFDVPDFLPKVKAVREQVRKRNLDHRWRRPKT